MKEQGLKCLYFVSLIGVVIRSIFVSLLVDFSLLTLFMGGLLEVGPFKTKLFLDLNILLNAALGGL